MNMKFIYSDDFKKYYVEDVDNSVTFTSDSFVVTDRYMIHRTKEFHEFTFTRSYCDQTDSFVDDTYLDIQNDYIPIEDIGKYDLSR